MKQSSFQRSRTPVQPSWR